MTGYGHLQVQEELPQNREHQPLQAVRQYPRLQPPPQQPPQPVLRDDRVRRGHIPNARRVHLAVGLDHAQRVRDGVRDDGRAEADERLAEQLFPDVGGRRQREVEEVIGPEPGVVSNKGGSGGRERAVPEGTDTVPFDLVDSAYRERRQG